MSKEEFKKILLLCDYGSLELAKDIYNHLSKRFMHGGLKHFNPDDMYLNLFNNGEIDVQGLTNVRGRDVFVIKSPYTIERQWDVKKGISPGLESNVNQSYMELFLINDMLRRSSANNISNIMPFMPYQRSDKKDKPRVPIAASLLAKLTEESGADRIINFNPHSEQIQGFYKIPFDALYAEVLFAEYFDNNFEDLSEWSVWSPDAGGDKRARKLAKWLGNLKVCIGSKKRLKPGEVGDMLIPVGYDIKGKNAIILDDMADTCGSLITCAKNIRNLGANKVYAAVTHPILSLDAKDKLWSAGIELITTNSIPILNKDQYPNITVLSLAEMISEAIYCVSNGDSISEHLFSYPKYKEWKNGI